MQKRTYCNKICDIGYSKPAQNIIGHDLLHCDMIPTRKIPFHSMDNLGCSFNLIKRAGDIAISLLIAKIIYKYNKYQQQTDNMLCGLSVYI